MREIKFRAWQKRLGFIGKVYEICFDMGIAKLLHNEEHSQHTFGLIDLELMQFTGLFDKEGVEIYEGDVVKHCRQSAVNGEVKYFEGGFIVGFCVCDFALMQFNCPKFIEVIGNIYESPELVNTLNQTEE